MNNYKISVIVPVYNVEKYVERCLDSLINQTYKNLEIIIVNDGSKDNSEEVILKKIKNIKNIFYYKNEKNSGLSYSRNFALTKCSGDYIGYIDSDDYVSYDFYEKLIEKIKEEDSEIAVCDINIIYENENRSERIYCGGKTNKDYINNGLAASSCNKIFKRELLKYKYYEGKINEDLAVILPTVINAKKISYSDSVVYNYIQRNYSIQNSSFSEKRFDIFYGVDSTLERIKDNEDYEDYKDILTYNQLFCLLVYVITREKNFFKRIKWLNIYTKMIKKYNITNNKYVKEFYNNQPRLSNLYYRFIVSLNLHHINILCSFLISFMHFYKKYLKKKNVKLDVNMDDLIKMAKKQNKMPTSDVSISVIIPNYNYERFLYQRLYSVLYQKVKLNEIIILDDCSKDHSRELIDDICEQLKDYVNIKKVYNKENSGSAFKQWAKGLSLSKSDYVWIAEADDYCSKKLIKELVKPIKNDKNIYISYADTAFIDAEGKTMLKSIVPEIDIMKTGHWNNNFINNGIDEFNNYSFLNCTIANVSSALIKREDYENELKESSKYKQAGDWLLYVNIMRKGKISYINKALNFYRVHGSNVSSNTKKEAHLKEIMMIHEFYRKNFGLNKKQEEEINKRYEFLKKVWKLGE